MSSRIPAELCDQVIDCLGGDKATLRACGITCRTWLPRARHHLFKRIAIDWMNCDSFTDLLQSSDDIGHHIQAIEIEGALGVFSMDRHHTAALGEWLHSIPENMPEKLSHLKELDLALVTIDATVTARFFARLPSVTTLSLCACTVDSFNTLVELLYSMPLLEHISISFSEWSGTIPTLVSHSSRRKAPQLKSVEMTGSCDNYIPLNWMISQSLHTSIESLSCTRMQATTLETLDSIISPLASSLKCLTIGLGELPSSPRSLDMLKIAPLPVLSKLILQVDVLRPSNVFSILTVLRHIAAPSLVEVDFVVRCADNAAFLVFPWTSFAGLFDSSSFSALAKLGFMFKLRDCSSASHTELRFIQDYIGNIFRHYKDKEALWFDFAQQTFL